MRTLRKYTPFATIIAIVSIIICVIYFSVETTLSHSSSLQQGSSSATASTSGVGSIKSSSNNVQSNNDDNDNDGEKNDKNNNINNAPNSKKKSPSSSDQKKKSSSVFASFSNLFASSSSSRRSKQANNNNNIIKAPAKGYSRPSIAKIQKQSLEQQELERETKIMTAGLQTISEPLKCQKSQSLDKSPYLLQKYGPVKESWCELKTSFASHWEKDMVENNARIFNNRTTYVDYPSSADGTNWPYYTCPVKYSIHCNNRNNENNNNENKPNTRKVVSSKALVIFIVSSGNNAYQLHQESINLDFFIKHGYIPANTPTALFDSVDFVFAKIQLDAKKETSDHDENAFRECGKLSAALGDDESKTYSNVKFMMIPKVSCDVAAHAIVMDHLKLFSIKSEQTKVREIEKKFPFSCFHRTSTNRSLNCLHQIYGEQKGKEENNKKSADNNKNNDKEEKDGTSGNDHQYSQIFLLNSGARGPFFSSSAEMNNENDGAPQTTWLDFTAMAGRRRIPDPRLGFFSDHDDDDNDDCPIHVATSSTVSFFRAIHLQSFFLSAPISLMKQRFFRLFANVCPSSSSSLATTKNSIKRDKAFCSNHATLSTGRAILASSFGEKNSRNKLGVNESSSSLLDINDEVNHHSSTTSPPLIPAALYSLSKQFYVQNLGEDLRKKSDTYFHPRDSPDRFWIDPCKSIMVNTGGNTFMRRWYAGPTLNAVDRLTKGASIGKKVRAENSWNAEAIQMMFDHFGCKWKF